MKQILLVFIFDNQIGNNHLSTFNKIFTAILSKLGGSDNYNLLNKETIFKGKWVGY